MLASNDDCLVAGDLCSSDETCSPRLRTLRQCVAGNGSMKLGPGARSQCANAVSALLSSPLHGCQCKRGMKKEKNCLSIYWSLHQSIIHGQLEMKMEGRVAMSMRQLLTVHEFWWYSVQASVSIGVCYCFRTETSGELSLWDSAEGLRLRPLGLYHCWQVYWADFYLFTFNILFLFLLKHDFGEFFLEVRPRQIEHPFVQTQLHNCYEYYTTIPESTKTSLTFLCNNNLSSLPKHNPQLSVNTTSIVSYCLTLIYQCNLIASIT